MLPRRRSLLAFAGALALVGMLTACAPDAAPTPTPTPAFASDEEAFAAAEKVYRDYNDAVNARNVGQSEPNPQDFLIGESLEADIDAQRYLDSIGVSLIGTIRIASFDATVAPGDASRNSLIATVCLDLTASRAVDRSGSDVTPAERPGVITQQVSMVTSGDRFVIAREAEGEAARCSAL